MASTYSANNGMEKPAKGDLDGTWGDMVNENMDIIDRALSGVGTITLSGTTHTLTTTDGGVTDGQFKVLVLSGSPSGTNTITISPSDQQKLYFVVNSSGQSAIFTQGTGSNVTVPNGGSDIIYADGGGDDAVVTSVLSKTLTTGNIIIPDAGNIGSVSDTDALAISSAGVVSLSANLVLDSDSAVLKFGDDQDVTVTHNHNSGLALKNTGTSASPATLLLQTGDTEVLVNDVLGKIQFQAPDEASGTDAILVSAEIAAMSEGTFAGAANPTKLSFKTAVSEAASEKMSLSSAGNLVVSGDVQTNDDLILNSDSAIAYFGADQDVLLTHAADSGLTMSVTGNNIATLGVTQDKDDSSTGPIFNLTRNSASPADNDGGGLIQFLMENDNDQLFTAAQLYSVATDVSDGTEDGKLVINTMKAGTATANLTVTNAGIVIADGGTIGSTSDTDAIAIRSDGNVGINSAGSDTQKVTVYDDTTTDQLMNLHQDNALSDQYALQVTHDGTGVGIYSQKNAGTTAAVYGYNNSSSAGIGTRGYSEKGFGGYFQTNTSAQVGCAGFGPSGTHYGYLGYTTVGVYGTSIQSAGAITGVTLSISSTKNFRISHGLREGHDLVHSSIEGPQIDVVYRGKVELVNGRASIDIDSHYDMTSGTFEWLTKSDSVQTFTSNETGWDAVKSSFSGNTITIECQNSSSTDTISWAIIAERGDPDIIKSPATDNKGNLIIEPESEPELELPTPPP